jgi:hypothetical protein
MKPLKYGSKAYFKRFYWFYKKCGYKPGQEMEAGFHFMVFQGSGISLKKWLQK